MICTIVELRRYTLRPRARETLIGLFKRELIESQEAVGMAVLGQFRDLDDPDAIVWLRGFADMDARRRGLEAFYGGPVSAEHRDATNATMIDSDDVLLLRATAPIEHDPRRRTTRSDSPIVTLTVHHLAPDASADAPPGALVTERAANDFPALPVREDANVVVTFGDDGADDPATASRSSALARRRARCCLEPRDRRRRSRAPMGSRRAGNATACSSHLREGATAPRAIPTPNRRRSLDVLRE